MKKNRNNEEFFVEGARYVRSAAEYGSLPVLLVCGEYALGTVSEMALAGVDVVVLSDGIFSEISDTEHSQGVLGVYKRGGFCSSVCGARSYGDENQISIRRDAGGRCNRNHGARMALVLDEVQDPGNVGAIIRTADAAGYRDIFVVRGTADPYSPKATRASAGSVLNVRVQTGTRREILDFLKQSKYNILVTAIGGADFREFRADEFAPAALVLGNEARGVHSDFFEAADYKVGIPIYGGAESLNVAVAAGILIYHFRGYDEGKNNRT